MTKPSLHHLGILALVALAACSNDAARPEPPRATVASASPATDVRVMAAGLFTSRYASSSLSGWNVRAAAAGHDCSILLVQVSIVLDDSLVEAMHYGAGAYAVYEGGVQHFYRERTFRGVAYKDGSGKIWTYGGVAMTEAETIVPCH